MDFHVTEGNELFRVLHDDIVGIDEPSTVYLAAGRYSQTLPRVAPRGYFSCSPNGRSLTITGEPGTSARDVIIDAQGIGYCLAIVDATLRGLPWETRMDPAFDRPRLEIIGITFCNGNDPYNCGGLDIDAQEYAVVVRDCVFADNASDAGRGAGLHVTEAFSLTIDGNRVQRNTLRERVVTTDSDGVRSTSTECCGAGVFVWNAWDGVTLRNNIVTDNVAAGNSSQGGGLFLAFGCDRTAHLLHNTICANTAAEGGGVHFGDYPGPGGLVNLYNNIVRGNRAVVRAGSDDLFLGETREIPESRWLDVDAYHNNCSRVLGTYRASGGNVDVDPGFVHPAGGDYRLLAGSAMIDAGTNEVPDPPGLPEHDIDGEARVNGRRPDIGADEYHPGTRRRAPASIGIWVDGRRGPVVLAPRRKVAITAALAAGDDHGVPAALRVTLDSPAGRLHLAPRGWTAERVDYFHGPLATLGRFEVPAPPSMARPGAYEFRVELELHARSHGRPGGAGAPSIVSRSVVCHVPR